MPRGGLREPSEGRPSEGRPKRVTVSISLLPGVLAEIDRWAEVGDMSRSEWITGAVSFKLKLTRPLSSWHLPLDS